MGAIDCSGGEPILSNLKGQPIHVEGCNLRGDYLHIRFFTLFRADDSLLSQPSRLKDARVEVPDQNDADPLKFAIEHQQVLYAKTCSIVKPRVRALPDLISNRR